MRNVMMVPAARRVFMGSIAALGLSLAANAAAAAIIVDGSLDAGYGTPKVVQGNFTGFGNNTNPSNTEGSATAPTGLANGSELDGGYGVVSNGNLNLLFTGNLELSFNHLNVFIGTTGTGGNTVSYTDNTVNGPTNLTSTLNGSTFPTNMKPIYAIDVNGGGTGPTKLYVDQYNLPANSGNSDNYTQPTTPTGNSGTLSNGLVVALNDTNIAGVDGNSATSAAAEQTLAAGVTTGFELSIPLSSLGNPSGDFQVLAAINGSNDGYLSNQFLGGLPNGAGNVASNTFNAGALGVQSFTVANAVPEPASIALMGMASMLGFWRRNRR